MSRQTVLLLFGGESSEHDISIMSARNVYAAMDNAKYDVKLCYIDKVGKWWLLDNWKENPHQHGGVQLAAVPGSKSFVTIPGDKIIHVDVALPILHGKNGEDGTVQGLLDVAHVAFAGPSAIGAAVTMDKELTKRILMQAGIPVSKWHTWYISEQRPNYTEVTKNLGEVVFVKPANAGSSHGVTKVRNNEEFNQALDEAAKFDSIVLIEEAIGGIEVQISVLGNHHPDITEICEIESNTDFHDFNDKYSESSSVQFHIPARLSDEQTKRIKQYALASYRLTRSKGLARIDFFVADDSTEYLNEINSIPGFTSVSVYPKLWHEAGMKYPQLIDKLIELALE